MTANRLEIVVEPGKPSMQSRYVVQAPVQLVFDAFTQCEHMKNWWGPRRLELVGCDLDFRVGGKYRFVQRAPDGHTFVFTGEFREIDAPNGFVSTFVFEGMPDADAVQTIRFVDQGGGRTLIDSVTVYRSVEARDGHIRNGMEGGMRESYERLDEVLASLQQK